MEARELIRRAAGSGRQVLTEKEAKEVLRAYGVPVVEEYVVSVAEAPARAAALGFPVVLKGMGAQLTHKTERGLVHLNLRDPGEVRQAAQEISLAAGGDLEGLLLQPFLRGRRELVAGLFHDPQFGPVVMFGVGGVYTEALDDVVFRLAPLREREASAMVEEIRSRRLLDAFRGEQPADRGQLARVLLGLSRLAEDLPEVREVDINPLLVGPQGLVTAVDALIVLGGREQAVPSRPPVDPRAIGRLFYPRSLAFVGASGTFGKWGYMLFCNAVAGGFEGPIYLVNVKGGQIAGRQAYRSVTEIPDPVDLAVVTVPAAKVLDLIPQFEAKGIKGMLLITSGFGETGARGKLLEEELIRRARAAGIMILGPNTMGICNPHHRLFCCGSNVQPLPGTTALVSQSGNLGVQLLGFAEHEGIGIRAFAGSGNEAMISIEDYLEAFEVDELTRTVVLYVESVKDGRRFFSSARRLGKNKPVVMLKGGRTEAGKRAAASHTGAMASDVRVFTAAARQAGVVVVSQPMDLLDLSAAFSSLPLPRGNRVAIMTLGGGWGVVAADLCLENGLVLPPLSEELVAVIDKLLPPYWSRSNPIDLVGEFTPEIGMKAVEALMAWEGCDAVIHLGVVGRLGLLTQMVASIRQADPVMDRAFLEAVPKLLVEFEEEYLCHTVRLMQRYEKPILGVNLLPDANGRTVMDVAGGPYKAVTFITPERAVKALARMNAYRRWRDG